MSGKHLDRQLYRQLEKIGVAGLSLSCTFFLYFSSKADALNASSKCYKADRLIRVVAPPKERELPPAMPKNQKALYMSQWSVIIDCTTSASLEVLDAARDEFEALAKEFNGEYDGCEFAMPPGTRMPEGGLK